MRNQKNNIQYISLNIMYLLFLLAQGFRLLRQLFSTYEPSSWQLSEFMINYQGGFVRRGLLGEILFLLANNFHINIEWTVKIASLICFVLVCIFFIRTFLKRGYSLYLLPLCFFLGMGILGDYWIRKDYLIIGIFISILMVLQGKRSKALKFLIINALFIFMLLTHEVSAFFSLPIILLLVATQDKCKQIFPSLIRSAIILLPSIACFLLTLYYHGNSDTALAIQQSWQSIVKSDLSKVLDNGLPAVESLGWTTKFAISFHFQSNFLMIDKDLFSSLVWCGTFVMIYYIATNTLFAFRKNESSFTGKHRMILSAILLFQLLCLIPVFGILSCDYIRLFFYWIASSFAIFLLIPIEHLENSIPPFLSTRINVLNNCLSNILVPTKTTLALLMLFCGISSASFYLESLIRNSLLYNVLMILSKPFAILAKLNLL